jgi:AcrR family transcriptional regulator
MSPEETLSKGERTRLAVLDAACELFLNQGYSATSMRQIADKAGIALGGIYNHFASKDEIFQELVIAKHPYVQIFPILRNVPGDTAEEFLTNAAQVIELEMAKRPDFFKLMFIELIEFNGRNFTKLIEIILPQAMFLLQRFSDPNSGARPIPPLLIMRTFLGNIIGFYVTRLLMSDPSLPSEMREAHLGDFVDIFLHGILDKQKSENL